MGQSLLEPARTFPWVSAHFHSAPFTADFSERAEFPFRGQICKRAEQVGGCLGKNLLVNAEQKQQGAEVSGEAERRFPEASFQRSVPTCFPTKQAAKL